jgi:protein-histidine pros-kinase
LTPEAGRFQALLESAPDAIVLADSDGRIRLVRRTEELSGYGCEELPGTEVERLVPERFRGVHLRHRAAYARDPRTREMGADLDLYRLRKDGTEFPVEPAAQRKGRPTASGAVSTS